MLPVSAGANWQILLLCGTVTLALGYLDFSLGTQIALSVVYTVPIVLAAWFVGATAGYLLATISVALWLAGDFAVGLYSPGILIPSVNVIFRLTFYSVMVLVILKLKDLQEKLETQSETRAVALASETAERERLQHQMLDISEREQRRIGQDLHDGLCQHLTGTALACQILAENKEAKSQDATGARKIVTLLEEAIVLARGIAKGLDPVEMRAGGLMQALEEFAETCSEMFGVKCRFDCPSPVMVYNQLEATHLFRIAQEAISNAIKHGRATHIEISLDETDCGLRLAVTDNGCGFEYPPLQPSGMGLRIMADRAKIISGSLSVTRKREGGTEICCWISRS